MAEQSLTVRIWASCKVVWDDVGGAFVMFSQDGKWNNTIVTEAPGQCVLSLLDGQGIDAGECQHAIGVLEAGYPGYIAPTLEHVDDEDKRIRLIAGVGPELWPNPFTLVLFQYTNSRSTATG